MTYVPKETDCYGMDRVESCRNVLAYYIKIYKIAYLLVAISNDTNFCVDFIFLNCILNAF